MSAIERTPQAIAPSYCDMVVDWRCDDHGEPGDEILCGEAAIMPGYCLKHAIETAEEGLDTFTREDGERWVRLAAVLERHGVPVR